jgi:hypothetical protein
MHAGHGRLLFTDGTRLGFAAVCLASFFDCLHVTLRYSPLSAAWQPKGIGQRSALV